MTKRAHRRDGAAGDEAGMTLVEVVVAVVILGALIVVTLGLLLQAQARSVDNRNRVAASNLAARELDMVREDFLRDDDGPLRVASAGVVVNGNPLSGGAVGQPLVLDGQSYTVRHWTTWNVTGTGRSLCEGGGLVEHPSLVVNVEVTWPAMGSTKPVANSTVLAPERGQGLQTTASFVAVKVLDAGGNPNQGRTVTVFSSSESRSGVTDASGCATVNVNPPAAGADYSARFPDVGYVDMSGTTNPVMVLGRIGQGQLVASNSISLDRAASLTVRVTGAGVSDADVAGVPVTLYLSQVAGATLRSYPLTGLETTIDGLWPTEYSAFFGDQVPAVLPNTTTLPAGGHGVLEVPFEFAEFAVAGVPTVAGHPDGDVVAVAPGAACTANPRVVPPGAGRLPAGAWDFYLSSDLVGCAPGPAGVSLFGGPNSDVVWAPSTLSVVGAPTGRGALWAVAGGAPGAAACTSAGGRAIMLGDGSAANVGPATLPAGSWYLFVQPDAGGQPSGACVSAGLVTVPYGGTTTITWPATTASVVVHNATTGTGYQLIASPTRVTSCTSTRVSNGGQPYATFTRSNRDYTHAGLAQGTWYVYLWRTSNTAGCSGGYPLTVGWDSSYTMDFSNGRVTTP